MGNDKRLRRGERSGRYGSSEKRDDTQGPVRRRRTYSRPVIRHRNRFDVSPDSYRSHSGDSSDEERIVSYPEQDLRKDAENKTIMLWGLSLNVTVAEIRTALEHLQGPRPVGICLSEKKKGINRLFAFVEFGHLEDSTQWMETNQNNVVIQGKPIEAHFYNRRPMLRDWFCNACNMSNFRQAEKCLKCGAAKVESQAGNYIADTLLIKNIGPDSTIKGILDLLSPYAKVYASDIDLIKDKNTGKNRGFAFVKLSSVLEVSRVLSVVSVLRKRYTPLKLDERIITMECSKTRKGGAKAGDLIANSLAVTSPATAASQCSSSQFQQQGSGATADFITPPETFVQQTQGQFYQAWQQQLEGMYPIFGDGFPGAASGMNTMIPAATGVVISQTAHIYQPVVISQPAMQSHQPAVDAAQQPVSVCTAPLATPAASYVAATACAEPAANTSAVAAPDTSTYQYDELTGYYRDPKTGFYYDPSSQFYYNSETQQFLYWDTEEQAFAPAPADACSDATASSPATSSQEHKVKKEKPKTMSAHKIEKNIERWTKRVHKKKERPTAGEDKRESASAEAGFFLFQKKQIGGVEMSSIMSEQIRILRQETSSKRGLVVANNADSDPEEGSSYRAADEEGKVTDWTKVDCLLCQRRFATKEALLRHTQLSDLHKENVEIQRRSTLLKAELKELKRKGTELRYRDRAAERRGMHNQPDCLPRKKLYPPPVSYQQPALAATAAAGPASDNIRTKMLETMGWLERLGPQQQGMGSQASLGAKTSTYEDCVSEAYNKAVRKALSSESK